MCEGTVDSPLHTLSACASHRRRASVCTHQPRIRRVASCPWSLVPVFDPGSLPTRRPGGVQHQRSARFVPGRSATRRPRTAARHNTQPNSRRTTPARSSAQHKTTITTSISHRIVAPPVPAGARHARQCSGVKRRKGGNGAGRGMHLVHGERQGHVVRRDSSLAKKSTPLIDATRRCLAGLDHMASLAGLHPLSSRPLSLSMHDQSRASRAAESVGSHSQHGLGLTTHGHQHSR